VVKKKAVSKKTRRPRGETKLETREALVDAGIALFGEQGLDGPSLDAVCERAGFTRGAFYVHFEDRDDFLVAVMDRVGWAYLDQIFGDAAAGEDLAATVVRFVQSVTSGEYPLTRKGGVRPHQLIQACARSEVIRERYLALVRSSLDRVADAIRAGQRAGTIREGLGPDEVATILLTAVIGVQTLMELGVPIDAPGTAATVLELLRP
jgi:TetR/AcrR family transcriptional regulator, transcriptional repressor for nem operon